MLKGIHAFLRPLRRSDLDAYLACLLDEPRDDAFVDPRFQSEVSLRKAFEADGLLGSHEGTLLVTDPEGGILGQAFYFKCGKPIDGYEIGLRLFGAGSRGQGFGTEAARMLVGYLFETRQTQRVQATTSAGNAPARRVLEKCGFTLEGVLRKAIFIRGATHDLAMFSITRDEWETSFR